MSLVLLLIGCMKPFKKVSVSFQHPAEYDLLFVTGMVNTQHLMSTAALSTESTIGGAIMIGVVETVEASRLYPIIDEFSAESMEQLEDAIWQKEGFQVRKEPSLVKRDIKEKNREITRELNALSGFWYHPEGNTRIQLDNDSLSTAKMRARWLADFNSPRENEAFLFSTIIVKEQQMSLFSKAPMIIVDTVIVDEAGQYLYQSRGIGYGYPSRIAIDYRRESLDYGLKEAIDSLNDIETEIIKQKKK